jgi:hypothetical protein
VLFSTLGLPRVDVRDVNSVGLRPALRGGRGGRAFRSLLYSPCMIEDKAFSRQRKIDRVSFTAKPSISACLYGFDSQECTLGFVKEGKARDHGIIRL